MITLTHWSIPGHDVDFTSQDRIYSEVELNWLCNQAKGGYYSGKIPTAVIVHATSNDVSGISWCGAVLNSCFRDVIEMVHAGYNISVYENTTGNQEQDQQYNPDEEAGDGKLTKNQRHILYIYMYVSD